MNSIDSTDTALRLAIVRRAFTVRRRGYDTHEVDELMDTVSRLADDLLLEVDATSRNLAEAEAELVGMRAELRELHEVKAAAEGLLAGTRAELRTLRSASMRDGEAEEKLVVAEAELRLVRASSEHTAAQLQEARELLSLEQAARGTVEGQLADATDALHAANAELEAVSTQLAAVTGAQARDPFAEVGEEVAALLRAAATSADEIRLRARQEADGVVAEAAELHRQARSQAERTIAEAEELAASLLEDADVKAADAEARAAAGDVLVQAGEALGGHPPFAMEGSDGD